MEQTVLSGRLTLTVAGMAICQGYYSFVFLHVQDTRLDVLQQPFQILHSVIPWGCLPIYQ